MPQPVTARCVACGATRPDEGVLYTCPDCGGNIDLLLDYAALRNDSAELRQALACRLAPLRKIMPGSFTSGNTPLLPAPRLGRELELPGLFLKDETRNLSGSLKDRASELVLMRAMELGLDTVAAASTGNAAASLAALAARFGMEAVVFAPKSAPAAKLRQIQAHGARLYLVDGNYDRAFDICLDAIREKGWYSRNTGHNPWCCEGKKSVALEIAEQCRYKVPDYIFVPVGDGCIIGGVHKGFYDLYELGLIERLPRIVAVQAEGSAAIANAWREKREIVAVQADTVADSIAVDLPRDGLKALRAVRDSNGFALTVSDEEILRAISDLARFEGLFAEPAGATAFAGLRKALAAGQVEPTAHVVTLITGTGLKDRDALAPLLEEPPLISSLEDLE
ncbi:MAG: threonine synthase [bacterium]|nr:threonine synthase [bacterium]